MVLGKLPVPGRPTNLGNSRARAYCACRRCGRGVVWAGGCLVIFLSSINSLFYLPLSLGDGRIQTKYCFRGLLNLKQPTKKQSLD